jgi:translation initiation factor 1A
MVKNTKGGSGHKSMARKFASNNSGNQKKTRFSMDQYEYYALVEKVLGNGMCYVICSDKKRRLCHIRGKFRGRGKRDNTIAPGSWVLVGGRDFESERSGEGKDLENCDLLEVYNDIDVIILKDAGHFNSIPTSSATQTKRDDTDAFEFTNDTENSEYLEIMESLKSSAPLAVAEKDDDEDEIVNFDDI